jgi:hypothetical protein
MVRAERDGGARARSCGRLRAGVVALTIAMELGLGPAALPATARAWCQMTTSLRRPTFEEPCVLPREGEFPLAWRRRCTSISLSTMGSRSLSHDEVRGVLRRSIDTWVTVECSGARTGLEVAVLPELNDCTEGSHFPDGRNVHSLMFVPAGWTSERGHDPAAYAVTLVWHDPRSGEIWDVDIEMNDQRIDDHGGFAICPEDGCPPDVIDLQNVLTHEMGHYFGLAHTPHDRLATMWAMAVPGETIKRDLQPDDIAGICGIYPPGTLPTECNPEPRGGLGLDCRPPTCGCRIPGGRARSDAGPGRALAVAALAAALAARRRGRWG